MRILDNKLLETNINNNWRALIILIRSSPLEKTAVERAKVFSRDLNFRIIWDLASWERS